MFFFLPFFVVQFSSESCRSAITCICLYATATTLYSAATTGDVSANVPPGAQWQWASGICSYAQQKRLHTKWWRTQTDSNTKWVSSLTFYAGTGFVFFLHCFRPKRSPEIPLCRVPIIKFLAFCSTTWWLLDRPPFIRLKYNLSQRINNGCIRSTANKSTNRIWSRPKLPLCWMVRSFRLPDNFTS